MFLNLNDRQQPEPTGNDNQPPSKYGLVFWCLFLASLFWNLPDADFARLIAPLNIFFMVQAFLIAGIWTAVWQLVDFYIWPRFSEWFMSPQKTAAPETTPPADDAPPPKPATAPAPQVRLNGNGEERRMEQTAVIWQNNHIITVANEPIDLADYQVSREQWDMVATARKRGQFPTISPDALHEVLRINNRERAENLDSDAHRVIGLLEDLKLIKSGGKRRPYTFTALGNSILPSPTATGIAV